MTIKFMLLSLCALLSLSTSAKVELPTLLDLKPGDKAANSLPLEGATKNFSYEISKEKDQIQSVQIEFSEAVEPSKYVDPKSKGHCLVQKSSGDVKLNRYFFFDQTNKRRYELTHNKKILGILIQEMPGAVEHTPCTLESFNMKGGK